MIYLKRSNVSEKKTKLKTVGVIGLLSVLFAIHFLFPKVYPTLMYPVTSIFWKSEISFLGWFSYMGGMVHSKYSLIKENKRLHDELVLQETSMLLLDALRKENEELKKNSGRSGKGEDVLGVVLSRPPITAYDTLVVDVGSTDGVSVGDNVYVFGDTLVGDVAEVYDHQSKISLFSTPGRTMPVLIGSSTVAVDALGKGGGNFTVVLPADVSIKEKDVVLSSHIRPHVFGVVEKILVDSSDSLQTVLFKAPVNIQTVRFVQVDLMTQ